MQRPSKKSASCTSCNLLRSKAPNLRLSKPRFPSVPRRQKANSCQDCQAIAGTNHARKKRKELDKTCTYLYIARPSVVWQSRNHLGASRMSYFWGADRAETARLRGPEALNSVTLFLQTIRLADFANAFGILSSVPSLTALAHDNFRAPAEGNSTALHIDEAQL